MLRHLQPNLDRSQTEALGKVDNGINALNPLEASALAGTVEAAQLAPEHHIPTAHGEAVSQAGKLALFGYYAEQLGAGPAKPTGGETAPKPAGDPIDARPMQSARRGAFGKRQAVKMEVDENNRPVAVFRVDPKGRIVEAIWTRPDADTRAQNSRNRKSR